MRFRRYLITGLLIWLPLITTVFVVKFLVGLIDNSLLLIPGDWQPEKLIGTTVPGLGILFAVLILVLTGALAANMFGQKVIRLWESLVIRIPLVKVVYSSVKQVLEAVLVSGSTSFRQVVLAEFPGKGNRVMGLVTGEAPKTASNVAGQALVSVFIPTTPNPTSGFMVMVPRDELQVLDMSVEEALKYVISMGALVPPGDQRAKLSI